MYYNSTSPLLFNSGREKSAGKDPEKTPSSGKADRDHFYKLVFSYNGTEYAGWQRQKCCRNTVQETMEEILRNIEAYRQAKNAAILMVSHSMSDVARLASRLLVLNDANLAMDGTPLEVFAHAQELQDMGLDIPDVTRLFLRLQAMGLPVNQVYTLEQAAAELRRIKEGNAHA